MLKAGGFVQLDLEAPRLCVKAHDLMAALGSSLCEKHGWWLPDSGSRQVQQQQARVLALTDWSGLQLSTSPGSRPAVRAVHIRQARQGRLPGTTPHWSQQAANSRCAVHAEAACC